MTITDLMFGAGCLLAAVVWMGIVLWANGLDAQNRKALAELERNIAELKQR